MEFTTWAEMCQNGVTILPMIQKTIIRQTPFAKGLPIHTVITFQLVVANIIMKKTLLNVRVIHHGAEAQIMASAQYVPKSKKSQCYGRSNCVPAKA